jgi:DNA polymerase-3 subunit alpha
MGFVHLHTHSEYSLLDGANRIPDLVAKVSELGMDSLAVTDHGNLHAAWSFYEHAKSAGVRPILGFEAYLAFGPRQAREKPQGAPAQYSHLVLLARNKTGYGNLIKLSSIGYLEGYYRRPRIDLEALEQHSEGLVGLAACLSGEIALWLRQGNYDEARQSAERFAKLFGPDGFWLEVQDHGLADEKVVQEGMFRLADDLGLPVVATNRRATSRPKPRWRSCSRDGPTCSRTPSAWPTCASSTSRRSTSCPSSRCPRTSSRTTTCWCG